MQSALFDSTGYLGPLFALTIHKTQMQSLEKIGVFSLLKECFTHGQLYVALSRPTSPNGIKIIRPLKESVAGFENTAQNVVFKEVLN